MHECENEEHEDLEKEYNAFQRAAVRVLILFAQIGAVAAAVFLCSVWWHYIILFLVCVLTGPAFGSQYVALCDKWWKERGEVPQHTGDVSFVVTQMTVQPAPSEDYGKAASEQIVSALDNIEKNQPPKPRQDRNWPFNK